MIVLHDEKQWLVASGEWLVKAMKIQKQIAIPGVIRDLKPHRLFSG
jgi:hypothetical protein